jgi:hypothetical protein
LEIEVKESFVHQEDKPVSVGILEIESLTNGIKNGSGTPELVLYVDEMEKSIKINMASFNMSQEGVLIVLVEAIRMLK